MKSIISSFLLLILFAGVSQAQSLEEIIQLHYEVVGKQRWENVKTVVVEGRMTIGTNEAPYMMVQEGDKIRLERSVMGFNAVQVYDGKKAFTTNPMNAGEVMELDNSMAQLIIQRPDFGTDLLNMKDLNGLSLVGKEDMDGIPVFAIKYSEKGKNDKFYYVDAENYILLKKKETREFQGRKSEIETFYSDFKDVGGIILAHSKESKGQGGPRGGGQGQEGGRGQWQGGGGGGNFGGGNMGGGGGRTMMMQGGGGGGMAGMGAMMAMVGGGSGKDQIDKIVFNMTVDPKVFSKDSLK